MKSEEAKIINDSDNTAGVKQKIIRNDNSLTTEFKNTKIIFTKDGITSYVKKD